MEYLIDLKFEDKNYDALVHFVATFVVIEPQEAKIFVDELYAAFERKNIKINIVRYYRIDNNPELFQRSKDYHNFQNSISTATIQIEQFHIDNPDQTKTLIENMMEKYFSGKDSTTLIR
jgi:hypothetical protein